jgi:hypothetical protein
MFDFIEDKAVREQAEGILTTQLDEIKAGIPDLITAGVTEATAGLKANHDKLLDEKKKLQETYKDITDPEKALEALKLITENDEMRLLSEGKFDEVIEKRLSDSTAIHEAAISDLTEQNISAVTRADKYQSLFETKVIEDTIREAAIGAKVLPHALKDALLQAKAVFTIAEDGSVEARDAKGKLIKVDDDKILTPTLWVEMNKKSSPHWWPASEGGDLNPGEDYESIDAQMKRAASKGDTDLYRKLKIKKQKATR